MSSPRTLDAIRNLIAQQRYPEAASQCLTLLRENPTDVETNLLYGNLAIWLKRPEDAIIIFRKLLSIVPDHSIAHDRLAYLYTYLADPFNARKHAEAALKMSPHLLESRLALASAQLASNEGPAALENFEAARKLDPGNLSVERNYIDALLQCGEFKQAQELLRQLIAKHPRDSYLYLYLARSQKLRPDSTDVSLLTALVDENGELALEPEDDEARVAAYMALYKLYSDLDQIDTAFSFLSRAKEIRRFQRVYGHEQNLRSFQQLRELFTPTFFEQHSAQSLGNPSQDPIFIICMPRSGSTLLERVLSSHPDIVGAGELPLIGRLQQEICAKFGTNQNDLSALSRLPGDVWTQIGQEYLRRARSRIPQSAFFVDKMPGNFMLLGFIRAALPRAKLIHLQRHPIANGLSIFETDFAAGHPYANDLNWVGQFYNLYRESMAYWDSLFGEDIIKVNYEDLVQDTAGTLTQLGQRLSLDFDTSRIAGSQQSGHIQTASLWQARQPIHTQSLQRWQKLEQQLAPLIQAMPDR